MRHSGKGQTRDTEARTAVVGGWGGGGVGGLLGGATVPVLATLRTVFTRTRGNAR